MRAGKRKAVGRNKNFQLRFDSEVSFSLMEQQIHFCTTADGARIAYAKVGQGPPLLKAANWLSHLEFDWRSPIWHHLLVEFTRHHTFIRWFGAVRASLGNKDEAFRWLDQTIDRRFGPMIYLKVNPIWDPLRSDSRFAERLRRVGLSQ
jgi:hypothetical protein